MTLRDMGENKNKKFKHTVIVILIGENCETRESQNRKT